VSPPPIVYDKAKYHFGSVHGHGLPEIHAYIHTGMFVGWLIDNALLDEEFSEECEEDIQRFLKREITAPQLFQLWDGALVDDMLSDEGNAFADCYFNLQSGDYIDEYIKTLCGALKSEFHVEDNWKNYNRIARVVRPPRHRCTTRDTAIIGAIRRCRPGTGPPLPTRTTTARLPTAPRPSGSRLCPEPGKRPRPCSSAARSAAWWAGSSAVDLGTPPPAVTGAPGWFPWGPCWDPRWAATQARAEVRSPGDRRSCTETQARGSGRQDQNALSPLA
jgi:hypothetical protein